MKACEWLVWRKPDGRHGCIPATSYKKRVMGSAAVKTMFCTEAEAIAECRALDERRINEETLHAVERRRPG